MEERIFFFFIDIHYFIFHNIGNKMMGGGGGEWKKQNLNNYYHVYIFQANESNYRYMIDFMYKSTYGRLFDSCSI